MGRRFAYSEQCLPKKNALELPPSRVAFQYKFIYEFAGVIAHLIAAEEMHAAPDSGHRHFLLQLQRCL